MVSRSFQCEQLFSIMNNPKSPVRSRLIDTHLNSVLNVSSTNNMSPKIKKVVAQKICKISQTSKRNYLYEFYLIELINRCVHNI